MESFVRLWDKFLLAPDFQLKFLELIDMTFCFSEAFVSSGSGSAN